MHLISMALEADIIAIRLIVIAFPRTTTTIPMITMGCQRPRQKAHSDHWDLYQVAESANSDQWDRYGVPNPAHSTIRISTRRPGPRLFAP